MSAWEQVFSAVLLAICTCYFDKNNNYVTHLIYGGGGEATFKYGTKICGMFFGGKKNQTFLLSKCFKFQECVLHSNFRAWSFSGIVWEKKHRYEHIPLIRIGIQCTNVTNGFQKQVVEFWTQGPLDLNSLNPVPFFQLRALRYPCL